jgi:hypothetical protein
MALTGPPLKELSLLPYLLALLFIIPPILALPRALALTFEDCNILFY